MSIKRILAFVFVVSVGVLAACQPAAPQPAAPSGTPTVLAVESFLGDIAQNVAGDRVKVETLMPLGIDPHAYEPAPQDVARIADSTVLIVNGAGFEAWLAEVLDNAGGQRQIIEAAANLTSRTEREGEDAVMTPEERADALCAALEGRQPESLAAGADAASAPELGHDEQDGDHAHTLELLALQVTPLADGGLGGYVAVHVAEAGDQFLAAGADAVLTTVAGEPVEIEERIAPHCANLTAGVLVELDPGEYIIQVSNAAGAATPLVFGPAAGHHHDEGDPHFWLDPTKVVAYVEAIRDGLTEADPGGQAIYAQNAAAYIAQLTELDAWITEQIQQLPAERRLLVTNHESFGYYADRYGLRIIGAVVPSVSTGSAPSAQQLARLADRIRSTGAPAIFLETGANPQLAQQLGQETGVKVVTDLYTHSVTPADGAAPTYLDMMRYNTKTIVDALK